MLSFWIFETSKSGALNHHTWENVQTLQKRVDLLFPLAYKQIETESMKILERALTEMLDLYLLTLFLTQITKHCNKLFLCCFRLVEF